jgi:hypothetical protein
MPSNRKLGKRYEDSVKRIAGKYERQAAWIGISASQIETGTPDLIYVRLVNGQAVKAVNKLAPLIYNYPVVIARSDTSANWEVVEIRQPYGGSNLEQLKDHHLQHEYPSRDTVWIKQDQFLPLLVLPAGGMTVNLYGGVVSQNRTLYTVANQEIDLSYYEPAYGAVWAVIHVVAGVVSVSLSSEVSTREALTPDNVPVVEGIRLCAIRLYLGQDEIERANTNNNLNDILDLRFFARGDYVTNPMSEDLDANDYGIINLESLVFNVTPSVVEEEGMLYWNEAEHTLNIVTGLKNTVLQVGQEDHVLIYNDTAFTIDNLTVLRPKAATIVGGVVVPTVELAKADTFENCEGTLVIATHDIDPGSVGIATRWGRVRGVDTAGFSPGDGLFLSATTAGEMTNVQPEFPAYNISMGGVLQADAYDGEFFVSVTRDIFDTVLNFWNGVVRESLDFLITEYAGVVTGTLTASDGSPELTLVFSDGYYLIDVDPGATITLTPGTDANPQTNYVYIPKSTKVLTVSTSDWATGEHVKIARVVLRSASTTGTDGALVNRNWNDHMQGSNGQGHLPHITQRIRAMVAEWNTGVEGSLSGTPSNLYFSSTAGKVYQMHLQDFPAFDQLSGDVVHIINDPTTPYLDSTDLAASLTQDATGGTLNNKYFSIVLWGIQNKSGEIQHVMCNLPTGTYTSSEAAAISDALGYTVYDIPNAFKGVGFLIARFTVRKSGTTWTYNSSTGYQDLRGFFPNSTAGGGGGSSGVTTLLGLTDTPSAYTSQAKKILKVNDAETALEFTSIRETLTANRTYYVATTGSDSNDGLTVGTPFLTIQKAYDVIVDSLDLAGYTVTVQVADGTYTAGLLLDSPWTGGGFVNFLGNTTTPANVIIQSTSPLNITGHLPNEVTFRGFDLEGTGTFNLSHTGDGQFSFGFVRFGGSATNHIYADGENARLSVVFTEPIYADSDATRMFYITGGASFVLQGSSINATGTRAFTTVCELDDLARASFAVHTWTGTWTGKRYNVEHNAVLYAAPGRDIEGDSDGTIDTGGTYNDEHDGGGALDDLSDVTLGALADDQLLVYNSGAGYWSNLKSDTYLHSNGSTLWEDYYGTTSAPAGYGRVFVKSGKLYVKFASLPNEEVALVSDRLISELGDVDLTGLADNQILVYDSGSGTWLPENQSGGGGGGDGTFQRILASDLTMANGECVVIIEYINAGSAYVITLEGDAVIQIL